MERELLTFEKIKKDLKEQRKGMRNTLAVFLALLPFSIWMFVISAKGAAYYKFAIYAVIFFIYALMCVVVAAAMVNAIFVQNKVLKDKKHIVIDEVTGVEEDDYYTKYRVYTRHIIHFSDFGEYTTLDKALSDSCRCNDKFYHVLSKPHTGKILLAYNTKRYVLEGEDQNASV